MSSLHLSCKTASCLYAHSPSRHGLCNQVLQMNDRNQYSPPCSPRSGESLICLYGVPFCYR